MGEANTGCPVPDVYFCYESGMINAFDNVSTFIHLLKLFLPMEDLFGKIYNVPTSYQIYIRNLGKSAGAFRALQPLQLILLGAFGAVDEPVASCMMVHFWVCFQGDSWCVSLV